jgi:hypothetical protein
MAAPIPGLLYVFQIQCDDLTYFATYSAGKLSYKVPLTNKTTIQADNTSTRLVITGSPTTNTATATLEATGGGTLQLETAVNNSGTIEALSGSTVILGGNFNGSVSGGTLTTAGTGTIQSQNGTLDGTVNVPTNAGKLYR